MQNRKTKNASDCTITEATKLSFFTGLLECSQIIIVPGVCRSNYMRPNVITTKSLLY